REKALLHAHLTDATAGGTGNRTGALLRTRAVAGFAFSQRRHTNGHGRAAHRLFQIKLQRVAQIAAALGSAARTAASTGEEIAEHVAEDIGEVGIAVGGARTCAHLWIDAGMTILVIGLTLARVRKH